MGNEHGTARLPIPTSLVAVREKRPCERRFLRVSHGEAYFFPTAQRKEQEQLATHRYVVFSVVCPCATTVRRVPAASSPAPLPANAHARLPDPLHCAAWR